MTTLPRGIAAILTLVALALPAGAQTAGDPAGHWEGAVTAPFGEIRIEVDLARNAKGEWHGAFSQPAQGMRGLPLSSVTVEGATVRFLVGAGAGASTFTGTVADGKTIAGDATSPLGTAPFKLTRTGDAVIEAPPRGAPVSKSLEGNWQGTLEVAGQRLRLDLRIANQADGTSQATVVSLDQGGLELPALVTEKDGAVTWEVKMTKASFAGALNADGSELAGTFTQGPGSLPLTFRRAAK